MFVVAVLRRYPALQGTLFELPRACAVAEQKLADEPECSRIDVVKGDLFKDPLPGGRDALLVANTAHVLSAAHNIELLGKLRRRGTGCAPSACPPVDRRQPRAADGGHVDVRHLPAHLGMTASRCWKRERRAWRSST